MPTDVWSPILTQLQDDPNVGRWKVLRRYPTYRKAINAVSYLRNRFVKDGYTFKVVRRPDGGEDEFVVGGRWEPVE
jgi:hypothetical protein